MTHTYKLITQRKYKKEHFINEHVEDMIQKKRMFMPLGSQDILGVQLPLDQVCALVEEIEEKDGDILVSFKVLDTPMGKILQGLLDADAKLKIYPIGLGSVTKEDVVKDDYKLAYFYIGAAA